MLEHSVTVPPAVVFELLFVFFPALSDAALYVSCTTLNKACLKLIFTAPPHPPCILELRLLATCS